MQIINERTVNLSGRIKWHVTVGIADGWEFEIRPPEPLLGFIRQAETTADSELQPIAPTSDCAKTNFPFFCFSFLVL